MLYLEKKQLHTTILFCILFWIQIKYKKDSAKQLSKFHLPMDMIEVAHAKKAQSLVSDHDYRLSLHHFTSLPDDMKVLAAKRAYELQSEVRQTLDIVVYGSSTK